MGPMRDGASDAELTAIIEGLWNNREDRYSELRASLRRALRAAPNYGSPRKVEMYKIGG